MNTAFIDSNSLKILFLLIQHSESILSSFKGEGLEFF